MTVTDEEIYEYLEHHGVKGMRWGKRKAKSSSSDGDSDGETRLQKFKREGLSENQKRALLIGTVTALTVGPIVVRKLMDKNKGVKISSLPQVSSMGSNDRFAKALRGLRGQSVSGLGKQVSKSTPKVSFKSERGTLEALKKRHMETNRLANIDLKNWYERSQTPIHAREYLSVS